ncbi:hypothetical protein [Caldovatus aquaticus]|uniref:Uncharacterized protein n=1 Tax=Caldovatus aquaticus TaxID=2865671 RepID=A0ABS7F2S8_9PROT|nr:hypothetical protein [Caldovatus aquaticus]MBW8269794.1 hypothetical protein [Caldovatus aquaticus]
MPPPFTLEQVERLVRESEGRASSYPGSGGQVGHPLARHERLSNEELRRRYAEELAAREEYAELHPDDEAAQRRQHEAIFLTAFVRTLDVFQFAMAALNSPAGHDAWALMFHASNSHDNMRAVIHHNLTDGRGAGIAFPIRYAMFTTGANPARASAVRVVVDRMGSARERLHVQTVMPVLEFRPDGCVVRNRAGQVVGFDAAELAQRRLVLTPRL